MLRDYNLCVISTEEMDINDCRAIKEYIRKQFNEDHSFNDKKHPQKVNKIKGFCDLEAFSSASKIDASINYLLDNTEFIYCDIS